jgi:hypothetical protein
MQEENYSKRELDEHFKDVKGLIEGVGTGVNNLNTKVGIQNGRIAKLEGRFNGWALAGTCAVFLIGIIMSLVVYSFKLSQENLRNTILLELQEK